MKRDHLSGCSGCGSGERFFLFNVRLRASYRRLCTSCVLKNYGGSFCPICFEVYDESPPPHERVMCLKCPSISHLTCVGGGGGAAAFDLASRYECPTCANPNFLFFDLAFSNKKFIKTSTECDGDSAPAAAAAASEAHKRIDKDSSKVVAAAARIATASMNKAAAVARVEAERRVKEAALAKKRAREALERLAFLVSKDKEKNKDTNKDSKPKVDGAVSAPRRIQNQFGVDGIDKPGIVPATEVVLGSPRSGAISIESKDRQACNVQGESDSNGLYSVPPVSGPLPQQQQQQQSSHGRED